MQLKLTWNEFETLAMESIASKFQVKFGEIGEVSYVEKNAYEGEISIPKLPDFVYINI